MTDSTARWPKNCAAPDPSHEPSFFSLQDSTAFHLRRIRLESAPGATRHNLRRWTRVQTMRKTRAVLDYDQITRMDTSDGLVKAYADLRKGEIYAGENRPDKAREMFQAVLQMP